MTVFYNAIRIYRRINLEGEREREITKKSSIVEQVMKSK